MMTEESKVTLPPEIIVVAEKYSGLLKAHAELVEAAAKMKAEIDEAVGRELAQRLDAFCHQLITGDMVISDGEKVADNIAAELLKIMPQEVISEITHPWRWEFEDDEGTFFLDFWHVGTAVEGLCKQQRRQEKKREYASKYYHANRDIILQKVKQRKEAAAA